MRPTYVSPVQKKLEAKINIALSILLFLFPFLVIWVFWFATGMAFSTQTVFNSNWYWTATVLYEIIFFPPIAFALWDNNRKRK